MTDSKIAYLNLSVTQNGENPPNIKCESSGTFEGYFYAARHLLEQFTTRHGMLAAVRDWAIESGYFELRKDVERALQSDIAAHHEVTESLPQTPPVISLAAKMWQPSEITFLEFVGGATTAELIGFFRTIMFPEKTARYMLLAAASYIEDSEDVKCQDLAKGIRAFVASELLDCLMKEEQKTEIKINEII